MEEEIRKTHHARNKLDIKTWKMRCNFLKEIAVDHRIFSARVLWHSLRPIITHLKYINLYCLYVTQEWNATKLDRQHRNIFITRLRELTWQSINNFHKSVPTDGVTRHFITNLSIKLQMRLRPLQHNKKPYMGLQGEWGSRFLPQK